MHLLTLNSKSRALGQLFLLLLSLALLVPAARAQVKKEILPDGVEHWYLTKQARSYLDETAAALWNVAFSKNNPPPFGRSIAFLVGVSVYHNNGFRQLPSVNHDLEEMRNFVFGRAGFDEVYLAKDDVVNRDLIEKYVKDVIISKMERNDRLLFYYSGHGGDNQGKTGYMLFGGAERKKFWGPQVLAIDTLTDWSRELHIAHILFILDSCASGLGIVSKDPSGIDREKLLIRTLQGKGSRTVLTAGTAEEETYALAGRETEGYGVFTKAFLDSFQSRSAQDESAGFITVPELYAEIQTEMAQFRLSHGMITTPQLWPLQVDEYGGTFVFLDPTTKTGQLTDKQVEIMGAKRLEKKGATPLENSGQGSIQVYSGDSGQLYIDDRYVGIIVAGQTRQFLKEDGGQHNLRFVTLANPEENKLSITVESGGIVYANFGLTSPVDKSGSLPVGTLVVGSNYHLTGEVYLDGFHFGQLKTSDQLTIENVVAGKHTYQIVDSKQTEEGGIVVKPGEVQYTSLLPRPPTSLTATVQ
jgi:Caspase domain